MSSSNFVELPPELVLRVMSQLDTPRDLFAIVRSSQYLYQAFRSSRTAVLVDVIEESFPAGNIGIAVAAYNAAQVSKVWWAQYSTTKKPQAKDATAFNKACDEFYKNNPGGSAAEGYSVRDESLLISLYRLWWIIDYFLSHFERKALSAAARKIKQEHRSREATQSEKGRLQRAFLRFEVYRRIFPNHLERSRNVENEAPRYGQILPFLKWFPPWEREEILSVQEFLVDFSKDIVRTTGGDLVNEFFNIARDIIAMSEAERQLFQAEYYQLFETESDQLFEPEPMESLKAGLDLSGLDVFLHDNDLTLRRFQYFVGRGLPFLKWLSYLPLSERAHFICSHCLLGCIPTFFEGLSALIDSDLVTFDAQMRWPDEARAGKSPKHPNEGWTWGKAHIHAGSNGKSMLLRYDLRAMGYVFWDTARLHDEWSLSKISPSMLKLSPRPWDDDDVDWLHESSIEERFKDIPHPKGAMERLIERMGRERPLPNGYPPPFSDKEAEIFYIEY